MKDFVHNPPHSLSSAISPLFQQVALQSQNKHSTAGYVTLFFYHNNLKYLHTAHSLFYTDTYSYTYEPHLKVSLQRLDTLGGFPSITKRREGQKNSFESSDSHVAHLWKPVCSHKIKLPQKTSYLTCEYDPKRFWLRGGFQKPTCARNIFLFPPHSMKETEENKPGPSLEKYLYFWNSYPWGRLQSHRETLTAKGEQPNPLVLRDVMQPFQENDAAKKPSFLFPGIWRGGCFAFAEKDTGMLHHVHTKPRHRRKLLPLSTFRLFAQK